jgi:large subunit ribosomal protein L2
LKDGDLVISGETVDIQPGNTLPLRFIPLGTLIHNVEMRPGKGAQMVRAAGTVAQLLAKEGNYSHIRLPSGEVRLVHLDCKATIGQVSNIEHENISAGKAGRNRWMGWRPWAESSAKKERSPSS